MRHYAGSVFDLDDATGVSGWDPDERVRERQSFFNKRTYFLPDAGNGSGVELLVSDTVLCPPEIFEGMDLRSGPCRVTAAQTGIGAGMKGEDIPAAARLSKDHAALVALKGIENQGIEVVLPQGSPRPRRIEIVDRRDGRTMIDRPEKEHRFLIDLSDAMPGFYHIRITGERDFIHLISVLKCFPLVVNYDTRTGAWETIQTIW